MSAPTQTRPARPRASAVRFARPILLLVIAIAIVLLGARAFEGPSFVDEVTIVNPTRYDVDVDVSGADGRLLGLSYVGSGQTLIVQDTIDQGDTWIFHFTYGGTDAGSLRLDRGELAAADWTVEVPTAVADRLADAGHEPRPTEEE